MRVIAVLAIVALALSGCAGETTFGPTATSVPDETGNETVEKVNETANRAPIAIFEADVANGTAPLRVNFTIDASDMDGDNMTWTVAHNGTVIANGTAFPAAFDLTLLAGNHTVALTVSDGINDTVEVLEFTVLEAIDVEPAFEPVVLTQAILTNCPHCLLGPDAGSSPCISVLTHDNGIDCAYFEVDPAWIGQKWSVGGPLLPIMEFWSDCTATDWIDWSLDGSGTIPEGTGCLVVYDAIDPYVTVTVTIS